MAPSGSSSKSARGTSRGTAGDKVAALRKEQAARDRRRNLLIWGSVAAVLAIIAGSVTFAIVHERRNAPDLSAVQTYEVESQHTSDPVTYEQTPPVGGPHNATWLNCGVYTEPVPNEFAVHALEHGAVWVTYDPDLPAADVEKLQDALPDTYSLLSPYEDLPSPVVVSSWGRQLELTGADDERLAPYVKQYWQGPDTPEPGAACTGGVNPEDVAGQG